MRITPPLTVLVLVLAGVLALGLAPEGVAQANDTAAPHSLVIHVAPQTTIAGEPLELAAMIDAPYAEALAVTWRAIGETAWHDVAFERSSAGRWFAILPPAQAPGLEYFIHGRDTAGAEVAHFASAEHPHVVRVAPDEVDQLEAIDLVRTDGRRDAIAVDVTGHSFGNRYGYADRYLRAEATFTHLVLRTLHHIAFGFGAIQGETPNYVASPAMDTDSVTHALRYGFGELRLRPHRSVFVDLRIALGVSHDVFAQGARGQITFGKPWRASFSVGGEALTDLGATGWVRLQWDTAPPVLMGASIVRTNLPGVIVDPNGLYVAYDVAYRFGPWTLKGQLSYGARDGAAHLGGGLGTAIAF